MTSWRLLIGIAITANAVGAQTPTGVVAGTVLDETGRPVRDAVVVLDAETTPLRARAGAEGRFRIERVPLGGHELQVVRFGFRPHRSRIIVTEAGFDIEVTLEHAPMLLDTVAVRVSRGGIHDVVITRAVDDRARKNAHPLCHADEVLFGRHTTSVDPASCSPRF